MLTRRVEVGIIVDFSGQEQVYVLARVEHLPAQDGIVADRRGVGVQQVADALPVCEVGPPNSVSTAITP